MDEIEGKLRFSVGNYPLTKEQIEELLGKKTEDKVDTDQEDVPFDVLKCFSSAKRPLCPNCKQNAVKVQVSPIQPSLCKCSSCGYEAHICEWD